jgi:hypothetical protein
MGDDVTLPAVSRHRFDQKFSTITFRTGDFMACVKRDLISSDVLQKMYKGRWHEEDISSKEII